MDTDKGFQTLESWQKRYHLVRWLYATIALFGGILLQATFDVWDWAQLPGANRQEIVLVQERMAEWEKAGVRFERMEGDVEDIQDQLKTATENIKDLSKGQYRIELRVERLDERTKK